MGNMYFNCAMCTRVTSLNTDTWLGDGVMYCGKCGRFLHHHVVIGDEELHLYADRYGWDATLGQIMDMETKRHQKRGET